ncbi:N-acetylneuraminate synthase [uncultured Pseudodesulfovibrio sp.]|uniref:N-acetylneuraminate synthase n=1 Tax=uncultured Pseudodesulfovibrio sp. TaxID=2035858 RepID=UPI0029C905EC|nr:N-acetylneuraminate synthase [uncultured Pseudodesulfovibrio sp.]
MKEKIFIIAEAGVNHNGDEDMAFRLVDAAAEAGADAVKFQTFKAELLVTGDAGKAEYQKSSTAGDDSQINMLRGLELDGDMHHRLADYCKEKGILFLSTAFDLPSVDLLDSMGLDIFKIPSGEITNLLFLRKIGGLGKRVIMSTGMSMPDEIAAALEVLVKAGTPLERISVLHCNTEYPTPFEDVNLRAMNSIGRQFPGIRIGYSDHTLGIEVPIAAAALGASIIEKHFTLDKTLPGPDHKASLDPVELKAMVRAVRNIESALGSDVKQTSPSEMKNKAVARKSIVAAGPIRKGEVFTEENLTAKRPGTGISPMRWDDMLGRVAGRDYLADELIDSSELDAGA